MLYLRLRTNSYAVPDLKLHNYAKITNAEMCLKTPGLDTSSPHLPQQQHGHSRWREKCSFSSTGLFYDAGQ